MKTYLCAAILLFSSACLFGQEKINTTVSGKEMSQGNNTAFTVFIPEASLKLAESKWKKYVAEKTFIETAAEDAGRLVENTYKTIANTVSSEKKRELSKQKIRIESINGEIISRGVVHENLTHLFLDIYARFNESAEGVQVSAFFQFSDSVFVSSQNVLPETLLAFENYIREFGVETYISVFDGKIKAAEKSLRELKRGAKSLKSGKKSFENAIARCESEISKNESNIELSGEQIKSANEKVNEIKNSMSGYTRKSLEYESLKELLKDREKERRKLLNQKKGYENKIRQQEIKIKHIEADIIENEKGQVKQQFDIQQQEQFIEELKNKRSNIK